MDCFIPNFNVKYENSENIIAERENTVVFNIHQIKRRAFFGTPCNRVKNKVFFSKHLVRIEKLILSVGTFVFTSFSSEVRLQSEEINGFI